MNLSLNLQWVQQPRFGRWWRAFRRPGGLRLACHSLHSSQPLTLMSAFETEQAIIFTRLDFHPRERQVEKIEPRVNTLCVDSKEPLLRWESTALRASHG